MSSEKTVDNWQDPKSMAPRSSALWEWYSGLSARLRALAEDGFEARTKVNGKNAKVTIRRAADDDIESIADEIDEHAAEMEYQCRI